LIAFLAIALHGGGVQATTVDPPDFASLVKRAEVIFRGQVTGIRSEWVGAGENRRIVSYVTFNVLKSLKGSPPAPFVLRMLGGTVGDETLEVVGAPKFSIGDKSLLFVEKNGRQFVPLVGMMHGHFRVANDRASGDEILLKHDGTPLTGIDEIDRLHARGPLAIHEMPNAQTRPAAKPMKCSDFEDQIVRQMGAAGK
jgi:hypothetical protein